jgi:P27 family predicted phage terminase small subunit
VKGRKPKPTHLHLVNGNPGKRRRNRREPRPARVIPSPPDHMSKKALVAWGALSVKLDRMGVLTEADAWALEQLAENYEEIVKLRKTLTREGRFQTRITKQGEKIKFSHPGVIQLSDAEKRFRAMLVEFGLTPSARARVNAAPLKDEDPVKEKYGL